MTRLTDIAVLIEPHSLGRAPESGIKEVARLSALVFKADYEQVAASLGCLCASKLGLELTGSRLRESFVVRYDPGRWNSHLDHLRVLVYEAIETVTPSKSETPCIIVDEQDAIQPWFG